MTAGDARSDLVDWLERCRTALAPGLRQDQVGTWLARVEEEVAADPATCITFDETGAAHLRTSVGAWDAGRFSTPTLADLQARLAGRAAGRVTLSVLLGADPLTDIGTLQAASDGQTLFQVASQFNCLEAPSAEVCPVRDYVHDYTQGPRAAVSAFPGTFSRHYRAPESPDAGGGGGHFVQGVRSLDLTETALGPELARPKHGYLLTQGVPDGQRAVEALRARFDQMRVGLQERVQVVFGHDWGGPVVGASHIAQVFTAAMALSYGTAPTAGHLALADELLRAGFLGTLLAAAVAEQGRAVLTLVGGGVFGNPVRRVWAAIVWAVDEYARRGAPSLDVVLNGYHLAGEIPAHELLPVAREHGGGLVLVEDGRIRVER